MSFVGTKEEEFNQFDKDSVQIFGFILCGKISIKKETLFSHALEIWRNRDRSVSPNMIFSLKDGFIQPFDREKRVLSRSPLNSNSIMMCSEETKGFPHLIRILNSTARHGRTVSLSHFGRYLDEKNGEKERFELSMVEDL